ncbi:unnamed protein product, partial [Rhizoctonia solani]
MVLGSRYHIPASGRLAIWMELQTAGELSSPAKLAAFEFFPTPFVGLVAIDFPSHDIDDRTTIGRHGRIGSRPPILAKWNFGLGLLPLHFLPERRVFLCSLRQLVEPIPANSFAQRGNHHIEFTGSITQKIQPSLNPLTFFASGKSSLQAHAHP